MNKKYNLLLLLFLFLFPVNCFAEPITRERSSNDYLVPDDIEVTFDNMNEIIKVPSVDETQKIYDFTNVLTDVQEKGLTELLTRTTTEIGIDSIIVFENDLRGFSISDYAYHFYDYNYFKNEGIILVVYLGGEQPELFMGNSGNEDSRVFKVFDDDRIQEILEFIYTKHFENRDYYKACEDYNSITKGLFQKYYGKYRVDSFGNIVSAIPWMEIIIMCGSLSFILDVIVVTKYIPKPRKRVNLVRASIDEETMVVKKEYDRVLQK